MDTAGVWISYTIMVNYLPNWSKEMLPVTRVVFDKVITNIREGILCCLAQIMTLICKAREDIHNVQYAMRRCEDALGNAEPMNNKSANGIKLLTEAVEGCGVDLMQVIDGSAQESKGCSSLIGSGAV